MARYDTLPLPCLTMSAGETASGYRLSLYNHHFLVLVRNTEMIQRPIGEDGWKENLCGLLQDSFLVQKGPRFSPRLYCSSPLYPTIQ